MRTIERDLSQRHSTCSVQYGLRQKVLEFSAMAGPYLVHRLGHQREEMEFGEVGPGERALDLLEETAPEAKSGALALRPLICLFVSVSAGVQAC